MALTTCATPSKPNRAGAFRQSISRSKRFLSAQRRPPVRCRVESPWIKCAILKYPGARVLSSPSFENSSIRTRSHAHKNRAERAVHNTARRGKSSLCERIIWWVLLSGWVCSGTRAQSEDLQSSRPDRLPRHWRDIPIVQDTQARWSYPSSRITT